MKKASFFALALVCFLAGSANLTLGADATDDIQTKTQAVMLALQGKLKVGETNESEIAPEMQALDDIVAEHKGEKTDAVARVLILKATVYERAFEDDDQALAVYQEIKTQFPDTEAGKNADAMITHLPVIKAARQIQRTLVVGAPFPDFDKQDLDGQPMSIASHAGKVVFFDFWATWCGPCIAEIPNVQKCYEQNHDKGFDVIGVSLDDNKDRLTTYIQQHKLPWQQFFDAKGMQNELGAKYGVIEIPTSYLIGRDGKLVAKNLRGEALDTAVAAALAAK